MNELVSAVKLSGVNTPTDHPMDSYSREYMRSKLRQKRLVDGLTFLQLSRGAGRGDKWASSMEGRNSSLHWKFDDLWLWGRTLGLDIFLEIDGIAPLSLLKIGPLARMAINDSIFGGVGLLEYLKTLRIEMGIEQVEMGRRLGVNHGSIWDLEESDNPKVSSLQRYVRAMGGSLKFVVRDYEPPNHPKRPF